MISSPSTKELKQYRKAKEAEETVQHTNITFHNVSTQTKKYRH
jgi:hypothetical protein